MAHSYDLSFFFPDDARSGPLPEAQESKPWLLTDSMPEHYAWLAVNAKPPALPVESCQAWRAQKHQQSLLDAHGLDERELQMMRDLKKTLQAETHLLVQRVGHWLKMFDPSLDVLEDPKTE